jgi:hypothetical protein
MIDSKRSAVVRFRLRPEKAQEIIRQTALDSAKVILGSHALQRSDRRDISDIDVLRCLQRGHVLEEPQQTRYKEWKCKVIYRLRGSRDAGIVTVIMNNGFLFVKTVEWEDRR